jgi:nitrogen fixation/metabolism regulation signal transduction histidine kinase
MRRFRLSRFELVIAAALALSAAVPLLAALVLASRLAEQNLALGLNPRLVNRLEATPALYRDLFQARKQLYGEQARTVAAGLPASGEALEQHLDAALRRTPRLRRAAVLDPSGAVLAEVEAKAPNPEGEWRAAEARVALPDGRVLECTFAIEARFFAELDDARELAEVYQGAAQLRPQIQRNYVRAFGAILLGWAVLAGAAGAWMARRTTRRVGRLVDATRRLARGDLAVQVDAGGADELATLARAFNAMVREVRESRDRIVYLEKISGWQDVARRLAHEIKNPLTPIQLAFQQLEVRLRARRDRDAELDGLVRDTGEIVREEIGTLQRLVEEFSAFAKLPDVSPEPAELSEVVEEFVRTSPQLAEEADVDVVRGDPCPVALDRLLVRRALTNLVRNAIEAARPDRARVHLGVARDRDRAVLTVSDEGPGIPPEVRDRMFDPYFTTRREGTGLGLAIVKKIVLQHGGEISAGARPGGGASFAISLPIVEEQPPVSESRSLV